MSKHFETAKIIKGKKPVKETLKFIKSGELYLIKNIHDLKIEEILKKAAKLKIKVIYKDRDFFKNNFGENHQGVVLVAEDSYDFVKDESFFVNKIKSLDLNASETILLLDGVTDTGNLGAIIRNAALFGVNYVVLPKDNSAAVNEAVVKRSAGACSYINLVYIINVVRVIKFLKEHGFWIYAADLDGQCPDETIFDKKSVIVMGAEDRGIRELVKKNCDFTVTINTTKVIDSLNVSVSSGIILNSIYRKLNK